jgi:hypothetical protein
MWWIALVACARASCSSTATQSAPYREEFMNHATVTSSDTRHRRSLDGPPASLTFNRTHLTADNVHAIGIAYKFMDMVYTAGVGIDITVQGSPEEVSTGAGFLVGQANSATNTITLYTAKIPNNDALVIVMLHEMFHLFGFSQAHGDGAASFVSRVNMFTLVYSSAAVSSCMGLDAPATVHSDHAHWNTSNAFFADDTMQPYIKFDKTATSVCTVKAVLDSRPTWRDNLCETDTACRGGRVCRSLGRHWIRVCQAPELAHTRTVSASQTALNVGVYAATICALVQGLLACHARRGMCAKNL